MDNIGGIRATKLHPGARKKIREATYGEKKKPEGEGVRKKRGNISDAVNAQPSEKPQARR